MRSSTLEILHLPMRSYEAFEEEIEREREYFAKNPELAPNTSWHWRRWIEFFQSGRLREEYESQFLDPPVAEQHLAEGRIVPETRLADWWINERNPERIDEIA